MSVKNLYLEKQHPQCMMGAVVVGIGGDGGVGGGGGGGIGGDGGTAFYRYNIRTSSVSHRHT